MAKYKLITMSSPSDPARDAEFNEWYDTVHLPELLALDGFESAQRYRCAKVLGDRDSWQYMAVYEIDCDDIDAAIDNMTQTAVRGELTMSDVIDREGTYAVAYEAVGPPVSSKDFTNK